MKRHQLREKFCRIVKAAGALGLGLFILSGCSITSAKPQADEQDQSIQTVKVERVTTRKIADNVEVSAVVESSVQREINSPAGGDVTQVMKKRGDSIEEGEVIVELYSGAALEERDQALFAVNNANAAILRAINNQEETERQFENQLRKMELELEDLTKNYNKLRNRYDAGAVSKSQVDEAKKQLERYQEEVQQAKQNQQSQLQKDFMSSLEQQLANSKLTLQKTEEALAGLVIKSPISGIITDLPIMEGMTIQSGAKICRIEKVNPVRIKAYLNEASANLVRERTELTLYKPGTDQLINGRISYLSNNMNPETKSYELNLEASNDDNALRPGMSIRVILTNEAQQIAVAVPQYSVITKGENHFVFVLTGDTVEKRQIQLGRSNDQYYEALSGVQDGEFIVISGQTKLKDKEKVQYTIVEADQ